MSLINPDVIGIAAEWSLRQDYCLLSQDFYTNEKAAHCPNPKLVLLNEILAKELWIIGNNSDWSSQARASVLSGQTVLPGSKPLAQAYAGHQLAILINLVMVMLCCLAK